MTEPVPDQPFPPGTVLEGLRLEQVLREAPSGNLYGALDAAGAPVLVRVLDPAAMARPEQRERVGCDLLALQAVEHPRLARVLTVGEHLGRTFYALEDRGRLTLADAVRRGRPLEEPELVWLARELACAIAALHEVGVVHGGLGAQSIALGADGPAIVDVDWCARGALIEPGDTPSAEEDVAALGRVLAFAATGVPGEGALAERALWLSKRFSGLVDTLSAPVGRRRGAAKAARLFAQIARETGLPDAPPARLIELAEPQLELTIVDGVTGELPLGKFGRYLLLSEVARGGMGVVYRARHADFERVFALKVMREDALANESARRRFLREAEAAAALEHPAIVRVHDCGEVDGRAYIAMDFTEGCPLSDVYRAPDATLEQLLRLMQQVVRAVHYAHSRGIVHRDLKPENLLVDLQGAAHILDFGVAKRLGGASDTLAGELVGTPAYMAPEQAEARHNDIDTRSDVYSLGATLFEVVTRGRLPFEGRTVTDTLTRILLDEPPPPSALRADVPWEIDAIVLKALEKRRERRYQSAAELADDIERFLEGAPIRARQASRAYRARKWVTRRWRSVSAVAVMSGALFLTVTLSELHRRAEVASLVARGEAALERRDAPGAQACFLQALSLSPDDMAAGVGHERAGRLLEGLVQEARDRQQRAQAARLLREGDALLAAGDLDAARMALEQAVAFFGNDEQRVPAQEGLNRVARLLAEREAASRLESQRARDAALALQHEADGLRHLERGDFRAAQSASIKAIAFGSARGEELLHRAEEGLLAERLHQVQDEVDKRDAAEAARLATEARAALESNALDDARTLFLQVLAFEGTNERALEGLVEVDRAARELHAREEREARIGQAGDLLERAREAHARGRDFYREGEDSTVVRASYFDALERYDRTLTVAPDHADARQERAKVAREAAVILRDEGQHELAELVLRFGGTGTTENVGPADLPADPHLVVVEADQINVRRAFGGVVRFQATHAFDKLRERVRARGDRWRVVIQVRSEPTTTVPPRVLCRSLWVRIEDRVANTVSPTIKVDFSDGPYTRLVSVDSRGRTVAPFDRAVHLDASPYVARVEEAVMAQLAKHTDGKRR